MSAGQRAGQRAREDVIPIGFVSCCCKSSRRVCLMADRRFYLNTVKKIMKRGCKNITAQPTLGQDIYHYSDIKDVVCVEEKHDESDEEKHDESETRKRN
eukprot:SM000010S04224  [mRNA]  locus=s10:317564:325152:+ [translate_table: standard]